MTERWLARIVMALILLALVIRVPLLVNAKLEVEGDEAEHLHAAWAVAHGQVPYRDFWQIHPPLLYYLLAPFFALLGEDLRIIYVARGLMLLCLLLSLLQLYQIARTCFNALTGLLAVCLLSYLWLWWRPAYDVRPDIPQTLLILMALWRLMRAWEHRSPTQFLSAGALLGVASCFLLKTLFPFVGLVLVFGLSAGLRRSPSARRSALSGLCLFLGGLAVPVALGGLLLWGTGAWPGFLQWAVAGAFRWPERFSPFPRMLQPRIHLVLWVLALAGVGLTATRMVRARVVDEVRLTPMLAGSVTAVVYLFLMPAPYSQSALPFLPLAAMYGAAVVGMVVARVVASPGASGWPPVRLAWAGLAALLLIGACGPPLWAVLNKMPPLSDQWADERRMIRYVLALTSPTESVFDGFGYYIIRPHASYYYKFATGVLMWVHSGFIQETDIMNDLRKSQCKVVIASQRLMALPPNVRRFLRLHYVSTGVRDQKLSVLVAGRSLRPTDLAGQRATVSLVASAEYAVRVQGGTPRVFIDGQLYQGPLFLSQGDHRLHVEGAFDSLVIVYSRVLAVPFQLQ